MRRPIRREVKELLRELEGDQTQRRSRTLGALVGGAIGATLALAVMLASAPWWGGEDQIGLAVAFFGIPAGAWAGAEIGSREGGRR